MVDDALRSATETQKKTVKDVDEIVFSSRGDGYVLMEVFE